MCLSSINGMVGLRYLSQAQLQGFSNYKYKAIDTSPLSNYVMHPFWDTVVKIFPMWVAPNILTFVGWFMMVINFALLSYYDWDYSATSNSVGIERAPIPRWVWLYCAFGQFFSHHLDGIDGKQARRTKSTSPLGELFDHGLDSWATVFIPLSLYSMLGRGDEWAGPPSQAFFPCLAVLGTFLISHWEKYITGVLYLPWLYDVTQLAVTAAYLVNFYFGTDFWHFYVLPDLNAAYTLKWVLIGSFVFSLPMSIWNIVAHYLSTPRPEDPPPRRLSFLEAMAPWVPFLLMSGLYGAWMVLSPTDIVNREPRIFLFSMGVVFSNIGCRLIISQMSGEPCELFNLLLVPLALALATTLALQPHYERLILFAYATTVLLAHLHYGASVVQELCVHFKIHCFTLTKS